MEKLEARGYEVLLLNEPLDEVLIQNLRRWKSVAPWLSFRMFILNFVQKATLPRRSKGWPKIRRRGSVHCTYESLRLSLAHPLDLDPEEEKAQQKMLAEKFKPLLTWLKEQVGEVVRDGKA